jgi:hypothetical protein
VAVFGADEGGLCWRQAAQRCGPIASRTVLAIVVSRPLTCSTGTPVRLAMQTRHILVCAIVKTTRAASLAGIEAATNHEERILAPTLVHAVSQTARTELGRVAWSVAACAMRAAVRSCMASVGMAPPHPWRAITAPGAAALPNDTR